MTANHTDTVSDGHVQAYVSQCMQHTDSDLAKWLNVPRWRVQRARRVEDERQRKWAAARRQQQTRDVRAEAIVALATELAAATHWQGDLDALIMETLTDALADATYERVVDERLRATLPPPSGWVECEECRGDG